MIKRALILLLLSLAPLVVSFAEPLLPNLPSQAQPGATALSRPGLRLLRSDERGVVLELTTPAGASHRLTVPGYEVTSEPGKPQVPPLLASASLGWCFCVTAASPGGKPS